MEEIVINQGLGHIFEKIFLALDAKTLANCLLVSRSLSKSLKNPKFWFKVFKQQNKHSEECFIYWNKLLEITDKNEPRKEDLSRILKIVCIGEKKSVKTIGSSFNCMFHPNPLQISIFCQEYRLANYILKKLYQLYDQDQRGFYILNWLKLSESIKAFHKFAKIYKKNFRIKVNALLMENIPKVLLTYENDVELFKEYLKIFGDSLQLNEYGDTLLHQAAELGCINIMKLLVVHFKDLNVQNQNHLTPIAMAVKNGKVEIVRFLLSKNVDPNVSDKYGVNPYDYAVRNEFHEIVKLLKPYLMK